MKKNNYPTVVYLLEECKIDVNINESELVRTAIEMGNYPLTKMLIEHGASYQQFRDIAVKKCAQSSGKTKNAEKSKKFFKDLYQM